MARRPSVQEILEAARRGGSPPAQPQEPAATSPPAPSTAPATVSAGPRPRLTLEEKLEKARVEREARIAARAAAAQNGASPANPPQRLSLEEKLDKARVERETRKTTRNGSVPHAPVATPAAGASASTPPPATPGKKLSLQEKLAAARAGGPTATATAPAPAPRPVAAPPVADRELPPLAEITDDRDLAESLRRTGARKTEEAATRPPVAPVVVRPVFDPSSAPAHPFRAEGAIEPPERSQVWIDGRGMLIYATWPVIAGWFTLAVAAGWLLRLLFTNGSS